jgi:hypothetical protein
MNRYSVAGLALLLVIVVVAFFFAREARERSVFAFHEERIEQLFTDGRNGLPFDDESYEESLQFLTAVDAIVVRRFDLSAMSFSAYSGLLNRFVYAPKSLPKSYRFEAPASEGMDQEVTLWIREAAISEWDTFFEGILREPSTAAEGSGGERN